MKAPDWVTSELYWKKQCSRLVALCRDVVDRRVSAIQASRTINRFRFELRAEKDPDFLTFTLIDSDTDNLPLGGVREHWSEEALVQKDAELRDAEAFYAEMAKKAAANLIKKYELEADQLD
jgi:hypothetical protein